MYIHSPKTATKYVVRVAEGSLLTKLRQLEDKFYTIFLYSLHAVLQHAFTLTHPKQNKNF